MNDYGKAFFYFRMACLHGYHYVSVTWQGDDGSVTRCVQA